MSRRLLVAFALSYSAGTSAGRDPAVAPRGSACGRPCAFSSPEPDAPPGTGGREPRSPRSRRKAPAFPGAVPVAPDDVVACSRQTGQSSPSRAALGKPSRCRCRHGYPQAFSLDPMPMSAVRTFKRSASGRLNSGLLKLTCPLLVAGLDVLEDEGYMAEINAKLAAGEDDEWKECFAEAHEVHKRARERLIFGDKGRSEDSDQVQMLRSKLGERGAWAFLDAGVAGASPTATIADVKCLHAWTADYLFRGGAGAGEGPRHAIGDAITKQLKERGLDVAGTDTCHEVCSGAARRSSPGATSVDDARRVTVEVPIPRNKQRRKRRQLESATVKDDQ